MMDAPQSTRPNHKDAVLAPVRDTRVTVFRRSWIAALALLILALVVALGVWLSTDSAPSLAEIVLFAQEARAYPLAPLVALACFVVGGLVVFPVNLLMASTIVVFGPSSGAALALLGSVLSAIAVHEVGRCLPEATFMRLLGSRGEQLLARVRSHGILAVAVVRIVPLAPYSIVSLVSGVARIRRRDYIIGTALGMAPGVALYAIFVDRAREVLLNPKPLAWLGLLGALILMIAVAIAVNIWQRRRARTQGETR